MAHIASAHSPLARTSCMAIPYIGIRYTYIREAGKYNLVLRPERKENGFCRILT